MSWMQLPTLDINMAGLYHWVIFVQYASEIYSLYSMRVKFIAYTNVLFVMDLWMKTYLHTTCTLTLCNSETGLIDFRRITVFLSVLNYSVYILPDFLSNLKIISAKLLKEPKSEVIDESLFLMLTKCIIWQFKLLCNFTDKKEYQNQSGAVAK